MPPAPTMPMMVAERVFDLEEVQHLARQHRKDLAAGCRSGRRDSLPPPVETMPSTGLRSAASIASEKSLPKVPMSEVMMASMPAKGPRPTTLTQISAQIRISTLRMVSSERRDRKRTTRVGR